MNRITKHRYDFFLLLLNLTILTYPVNAQVFNWCDDGYLIGGAVCQNIDNSGIDIEVSELVEEYCSVLYGHSIVVTGIDDFGFGGVQHTYKFLFSETIDLSFYVYDVNYGTNWNDQLVFSEFPVVFYQSGVMVSGNTISPALGSSSANGVIGVKFENIDSLIITHGSGTSANPGHIYITELVIGEETANLNEMNARSHMLLLTDYGLKIMGLSSPISNLRITSSDGREVNFTNRMENNELQVHFNTLSSGIYYLQFELKNGQLVREKFYSK